MSSAGGPLIIEHSAKVSLEAYNTLRANVTEAAKHSRNLFMTHLAVQSYALIVLAGLDDLKFFQGNQQTLPIINASVALSWFLPTLATLSFLVFVYWQMYHRKMWLLAGKATEVAAAHREHPGFVPSDGIYRYPWIAFFVADGDRALRIGVAAFAFFQWAPMPLVQYVCWARTIRLGGDAALWISAGLPWAPFFGCSFVVSVVVTWWLSRLQRKLTPRPSLAVSRKRWMRAEDSWIARYQTLARCSRVLGAVVAIGVLTSGAWTGIAASKAHKLQLDHLKANGRNLAYLRAAGASLSGASLSGANLYGANLEGANLRGAKLDGANLGGRLPGCEKSRQAIFQTISRRSGGDARSKL